MNSIKAKTQSVAAQGKAETQSVDAQGKAETQSVAAPKSSDMRLAQVSPTTIHSQHPEPNLTQDR